MLVPAADLQAPVRDPNARLILHFGAVDYRARVWVDGRYAGGHSGGYTPWSLDITEFVGSEPEHGLIVRVDDDPQDLTKPRGKQDWPPAGALHLVSPDERDLAKRVD